jgi:hypothetical protein
MTNVVSAFVLDLVERAVKTSAQAALAVYSLDAVLHTGSLVHVAQIAGGAAVFSVLTSLASQPLGNKATASLLSSASSQVVESVSVPLPSSVTGVSDL